MDDSIRRARARIWMREQAARYLFDPRYDVTAVDYGAPVREESDRDPRPTLRFHVPEKRDRAVLESTGACTVPERIGEFETDVIEGVYRPSTAAAQTQRHDPLRGGVSISRVSDPSAGTLGGLVRDRASGEAMILSNWHVLVVSWGTLPGRPIIQPGGLDGGGAPDVIARLTRDAMSRGLDAAVATLTGSRPLVNSQVGLGAVTGVARPQLGMRLTKSGRTTGITSGVITGLDGVVRLWYGSQERLIRNVVTIEPAQRGTQVSEGGDSGSWWLDAATRRAVGLHFAGGNWPERGLAIDMQVVLDALAVDIIADQPAQAPARRRPAQPVEVVR